MASSWAGRASSRTAPFLAGGPGFGFASTSPVSRRRLSQRLMVGTETPKTSATSLLGIPRSTASSTLSLKSLEYGFIPTSFAQDQLICKPLSESNGDGERVNRPEDRIPHGTLVVGVPYRAVAWGGPWPPTPTLFRHSLVLQCHFRLGYESATSWPN